MPAPHPPEFRRRAVELAREKAAPIAQIAKELGISESCLRNWIARADVDEGRREGLTSDERRAAWHRSRRGSRGFRGPRHALVGPYRSAHNAKLSRHG
jgi:transposase